MAAVIRVPPEQLGNVMAADVLAGLKAVRKTLYETVATQGIAFAIEELDRAKPRPPMDRGAYKRSFRAVRDGPDAVWLLNTQSYAGVIEHGRRKGARQPPSVALTAWVFSKGLIKGGRGKIVSEDKYKAAQRIAFLIGRKMKRLGWPFPPNAPMQIINKAARRLVPILQKNIEAALGVRA